MEKTYYESLVADDDQPNVIGCYTDGDGDTVIMVLDDAQAVTAPFAAEGVKFIKTSPISIGPPWWPDAPSTPEEFKPLDYINPRHRHRPAPAGVSCGSYRITAGTLGCYVIDAVTGELCILSNNHVLADVNRGATGDDILQPGAADGGVRLGDTIADLTRFIPISNNVTVDAAIARIKDEADADQNIIGIGWPHGLADAYLGQRLKKYGRTSEYSHGPVAATNATVRVNYGTREYTLTDLIITGVPSFPGDSGSLCVDFASNAAVGLLFAGGVSGGYGITVLCKMSNVADLLNITIPEPPVTQRSLWLDVSRWQGEIDFEVMKSRGVRGVMMKICQGAAHVDPMFATYFDAAQNAGLLVGGYVYVDPDFSPSAHLANLQAAVGERLFDTPIALDVEEGGNVTALVQSLAAMVTTWDGQRPMIYTSPGFWNDHVNRWSGWKDYPLWVAYWSETAQFPGLPLDWQGVTGAPVMWQFRVGKGIGSYFGVSSADIDMDTTYPSFEAILEEQDPPPPPEMVTLEIEISGNGYVSPGEGQYPIGSTITLTATPDTGWRFASWGGDLSGDFNPSVLLLDDDKAVIANFVEGGGGPAVYTHHKGRTLVDRQNYRRVPSTAGNTPIGTIPKGTVLDILGEIEDQAGNTWALIGYSEYAAIDHNGTHYIDYVMEG